jgi:hypothetical protein
LGENPKCYIKGYFLLLPYSPQRVKAKAKAKAKPEPTHVGFWRTGKKLE